MIKKIFILSLGLISLFLFFVLTKDVYAHSGTVSWSPSEIFCGATETFSVSGHSQVWIDQTKNGSPHYSGPLSVPLTYTTVCNQDEGFYTTSAYHLVGGARETFIGTSSINVRPFSPTSCSLSGTQGTVYIGQTASWTVSSSPAGFNSYWHGTKNSVTDVNDLFAGTTNFTTSYTYQQSDVGNFTRYLHVATSTNHSACTTNQININVVPPVLTSFSIYALTENNELVYPVGAGIILGVSNALPGSQAYVSATQTRPDGSFVTHPILFLCTVASNGSCSTTAYPQYDTDLGLWNEDLVIRDSAGNVIARGNRITFRVKNKASLQGGGFNPGDIYLPVSVGTTVRQDYPTGLIDSHIHYVREYLVGPLTPLGSCVAQGNGNGSCYIRNEYANDNATQVCSRQAGGTESCSSTGDDLAFLQADINVTADLAHSPDWAVLSRLSGGPLSLRNNFQKYLSKIQDFLGVSIIPQSNQQAQAAPGDNTAIDLYKSASSFAGEVVVWLPGGSRTLTIHRPTSRPTITSGPVSSNARNASFTWSGANIGAGSGTSPRLAIEYRFRLDSGAWSSWAATTSTNYNNLSPGSHTFEVQSRNGYESLNNAVGETASWTWSIGGGGAPLASDVSVTQPDYCVSGPAATISWTYSDPDGDPQSAYQVQVDDRSSFNSPEADSEKVLSSATSYYTGTGRLVFNTTYKARVRVWDSNDIVSSWTESSSWRTPNHAYPQVNFSWSPTRPSAGQEIQFTDSTVFSDPTPSGRRWSWAFGDGGTSTVQNPIHAYVSNGTYTVTETVTDSSNFQCSLSQPLNVQRPIPFWKEILPL